MASTELRGDSHRLIFRYGGRKFSRSLKTRDSREAEAVRVRVEENVKLLERGRLELPPGADLVAFLFSDGKLGARPEAVSRLTLGRLLDLYVQTLTEGAKAATTLATERTHVKHLKAVLKASTPVDGLTKADTQAYADTRSRKVRAATVKKEMATLAYIWRRGLDRGHVRAAVPSLKLTFCKQADKQPFRTWEEILAIIDSGHLGGDREAELWKSLYLDEHQVREVLEYVRDQARHPFVYPMVAFAAYTGARRSEIVASQRSDIDLANQRVLIREEKRKHERGGSFRHVPLHPGLARILGEWLAAHPGGPDTFCRRAGVPLTWNAARKYLRGVLDGGRWAKIAGWHVFRHSFASICARRGTPQAHLDAWLGHQTEAMRERYRHLYPRDQQAAIRLAFPEGQ